ncbi:MAG: hypothetical protein NTY22_01780, partial [Proteobacteria bacterium]|nr:hypothetical protein [Pseudomonadota bacterium]
TSKKVMSLNIDTIFGTGPDDNDVTWVVSVTILDENHNEVYSEYYYDTRRVANISKEKVDLSKEDIRLFNTKEDYRVRLFYDAVSDHPSCARDDSNSTGHSLDDSIDAVLLGAREYAHKKYTKLPKEYKQNENEYKSQEEIPTYENGDRYKAIGILNNIPYCCTPDNNTGLCLRLKGNKEK